MKAFLTLILLLVSLQLSYTAVSAGLNQALTVNATATDYSLISVPITGPNVLDIIVSSPSASASGSSKVQVSAVTTLPGTPSGSATLNAGLPAGYLSLTGSLPVAFSIGVGFYVNFTADIVNNVNAYLVLNPYIFTIASINTTLIGAFRPLAFNISTNTYYELPSNYYNISASGGISIYITGNTYIVLAAKLPNLTPYAINIANGATAYANLVANTAVNFAVNEGTRTALYLYNVSASAGYLAVSVSSNAASEAVAAGQILVSRIYNFTHSAGSNAQVSAQLSYNLGQSGVSLNSTTQANAAWYVYQNGGWSQQGGSVNSNVLVYTTNHFSDWSVQSNNGGSGAGAKLEIPFFAKFFSALF